MPLGLPVVPEVYSANSICSASMASAGHSSAAAASTSWNHRSRPSRHATSPPVRRHTTECATPGARSSAASAFAFRGIRLPARHPSSWVTSTVAPKSFMRSASASAEKPPNTTVWAAPRRAQASMAIGSSGTIPM